MSSYTKPNALDHFGTFFTQDFVSGSFMDSPSILPVVPQEIFNVVSTRISPKTLKILAEFLQRFLLKFLHGTWSIDFSSSSSSDVFCSSRRDSSLNISRAIDLAVVAVVALADILIVVSSFGISPKIPTGMFPGIYSGIPLRASWAIPPKVSPMIHFKISTGTFSLVSPEISQ